MKREKDNTMKYGEHELETMNPISIQKEILNCADKYGKEFGKTIGLVCA